MFRTVSNNSKRICVRLSKGFSNIIWLYKYIRWFLQMFRNNCRMKTMFSISVWESHTFISISSQNCNWRNIGRLYKKTFVKSNSYIDKYIDKFRRSIATWCYCYITIAFDKCFLCKSNLPETLHSEFWTIV